MRNNRIHEALRKRRDEPSWQGLVEMLHPELMKHFKPAFLGRMKIVPYYPITDGVMRSIVQLKLSRVAKRMLENRNIVFSYGEEIVESIARRCTEVDSGARNADHILTNTLLPEMSKEILSRMAAGEQIREVKAELHGDLFSFEVI